MVDVALSERLMVLSVNSCLLSCLFFVCLCRDKVVDFHWNSSDPWTIVSVSDDGESTGGGGTLQVIYFDSPFSFFQMT